MSTTQIKGYFSKHMKNVIPLFNLKTLYHNYLIFCEMEKDDLISAVVKLQNYTILSSQLSMLLKKRISADLSMFI